MKGNPLFYWAAGLLLLAGLVQGLTQDPESSEDPRLGQPLVSNPQVAQMDRLVLQGPQGTITIQKQGEQWQLAERQFPADAGKLRRLMAQLSQAQVSFLVSDQAESLERLELGPGQGTLVQLYEGDKLLAQLQVGAFRPPAQGPADDADGTYVRLGDQAYLVKETLSPPVEVQSWLADQLAALPEVQIKSLSGPGWSVSRPDDQQPWRDSSGKELAPGALAGPLRLLSNWRFTEAIPLEQIDRTRYLAPQVGSVTTFGGARLEFSFLGSKQGPEPGLLLVTPQATGGQVFALAHQLAPKWAFVVPAWQRATWTERPSTMP
ncbi:MAG: DUF4340 domain-containing protein [bacterium]|nr:DUF4340 domain-containing protein [bacterium]